MLSAPEILSAHLAIQVFNISTLSLLYLTTQQYFAAPLLKVSFPPGGFNAESKGTRIFF